MLNFFLFPEQQDPVPIAASRGQTPARTSLHYQEAEYTLLNELTLLRGSNKYVENTTNAFFVIQHFYFQDYVNLII